MGYEVTWNDMRAELAGYVRLKQEFGTIHFAPGNAFNIDLPLPFDGVITEVIEQTAHPDRLLVPRGAAGAARWLCCNDDSKWRLFSQ